MNFGVLKKAILWKYFLNLPLIIASKGIKTVYHTVYCIYISSVLEPLLHAILVIDDRYRIEKEVIDRSFFFGLYYFFRH